ncbi:unnamed protein product [Prorocentrum cordatum]|uniref:Uncharacterized protein n=1 Tax=Prorocentrum cordatum TaxID=2364126 RepID=A0ABN9UU76_9DINO|nr:unnamed protein product [Polarella glacialis]
MGPPARRERTAAEWAMGVATVMGSQSVEDGAAAGRAAACAASAAMEGDVRATGYCIAEMTVNTARAGAGLASAVTLTTVGTVMEIPGAVVGQLSPAARPGCPWWGLGGAQAPAAGAAAELLPPSAATRATAEASVAAGAPVAADAVARLQALGSLSSRPRCCSADEPAGGVRQAPEAPARESPSRRHESSGCACTAGLRALVARRRGALAIQI